MAKKLYKVVFKGELARGHNPVQVKENLLGLFKSDSSRVDRFFQDRPVVVKNNVDSKTAMKYKAALERAGALCRVTAVGEDTEAHPVQPSSGSAGPDVPNTDMVTCPKCGTRQPRSADCLKCGVIMDKYRELESQRSEEAGGAGGATDDETPIKITQGPGLTETGESERTWAMVCHLSAFAFLFVPFGNVVGPLIIWLIKKDESSFVNAHGKAALNFQISLTLFFVLGAIIAVVASFTVILPIIILIICLLLLIYGFVMIIVGGVSAYNGNYVEIPLSTRFLK